MQQELQACKTSLGSIEDRLQKIDTALRGNGRKGLFTEFELLKSKVAQLEEPGTYRFHYITNRKLTARDGALEERFTNEREEKLKFGSF